MQKPVTGRGNMIVLKQQIKPTRTTIKKIVPWLDVQHMLRDYQPI